MLLPFLIVVVVDVVIELARCVLSELLYADDLIQTSETIEGQRKMFLELKESFECTSLYANLGETKVMVSGSITNDGFSMSGVEHCVVFSFSIKAISVLCVQCGRWIHGRYTGVRKLIPMLSRNFTL